MKDNDKIKELRKLLFDDDIKRITRIDEELHQVEEDLYEKDNLEKHVNPIIDEKLLFFERKIPNKMGPAITAALKKQISESQHEVIDAFYPIIGKLVSTYIRKEIEILSEKIDKQFEEAFSYEGWKRRFQAWFGGVNESSIILRNALAPEIHQFLVVQKGSGILLGSYSKTELLEKEMVAGMLSAIKAFSEDAFNQKDQELSAIEYDSYNILLFNSGSFYIAVVVSGVLTAEFRKKLQDLIIHFVDVFISKIKDSDLSNETLLSEGMKNYFDHAEL